MDWANIVTGVIMALAVAIGLPLALREPKYEYARVRTAYFLPSLDLFDAIDIMPGMSSQSGNGRRNWSKVIIFNL